MTKNKYFLPAAISIVVANMIGTGVFVSLGYQLIDITDYATIIMLWLVGGVIALCGAFAYSELGAALPKSGGEYHYLTEIYHPSVGFVSGWLSSTIGFAAPIALCAITFSTYVRNIFPFFETEVLAVMVVLMITIINSINHSISGGFQVVFTALKVLLIVIFIFAGFFSDHVEGISFSPSSSTFSTILTGSFAINLVYVSFAYSGWNASAYIASEVDRPNRNIPLSIIYGTLIVVALYVLLNAVFLMNVPADELRVDTSTMNPKEIGFIAASKIFNSDVGKVLCGVIGLFLVSSISSMVITGPRVMQSIANDYHIFRFLRQTNEKIPITAIWIQSIIACTIILTGSFEQIITYTTFALTLFSLITVIGVFVLRIKRPQLERPYKTFGYPFTPFIFIIANLWFLWFIITDKTTESLIGLGIIGVGLLLYFVVKLIPLKK